MEAEASARWRDIALTFLKLGATSYGGPAIMGIMQAELQDKRRWVSKERFVEGLSFARTPLDSLGERAFSRDRPETRRKLVGACSEAGRSAS